MLEARDLTKYFPLKGGRAARRKLTAVDRVSFSCCEGETFALVGESGSGKTTLAMLLTRLLAPDAGKVLFEDRDVWGLEGKALMRFRRSVQMVFQDPFASLDPRMKIGRTIAEGMLIHRLGNGTERGRRVQELLELVGLPGEAAHKYPHEFSGGQRQRIGIARALAVQPRLIVADEPVSALDVSVQAKVLNLLYELKAKKKLTFVVIAHNLRTVGQMADTVAVMYLGKLVELAPAADLFLRPLHPYTKLLLASIPSLQAKREERASLGVIAERQWDGVGCRFRGRCAEALSFCQDREPELKHVGGGRLVACHLC